MKDSKILYYVSVTEREGSWQRPDGYILSDSEDGLQQKINSLPKYAADMSWEYSRIKSFEPSEKGYERFCKYAIKGFLAIEDRDMRKFTD